MRMIMRKFPRMGVVRSMFVVGSFGLGGNHLRREHVHLGRCQPAAAHLAQLQARAHVERGCRLFKQRERDPRVDQRAQKHVAADP